MALGMMIAALLPLGLWLASMAMGVVVCASCVVNGALMPSARLRIPGVRPVPWSVVALHLCSVVIGAMAYAVFLLIEPVAKSSIVRWYESVGLVSAIVVVACVVCQLVAMYLHARNAMKGEMDRTLRRRT